ncbi:MAG: hypothetical protein K0R39_3990 [Symbiobacteriaceae bacterium]|jgi:hypothetical protein|nr:hypothetical protein [Symbiobacteriaceae bacterium]
MLPLLRKLQTLYGWTLVALTDLAVTIPWLLLTYRGAKAGEWHTAVPGVWLGLLVYAAASLWEAGDRSEDGHSRTGRITAAALGVLGAYIIAYFLLPDAWQTGILLPNLAWSYIPVGFYLWYQGTLAVSAGTDYHRLFDRFPYQVVGAAAGIFLLVKFDGAAEPGVRMMLYWSVAMLLAGGVLSLIVSREQELRAGQASIGEKGAGGERQSRVLSTIVLALLALTFAASYLMGAGGLETVAGGAKAAVQGVLRFLGAVVFLIIYRWMKLLGPFIEWIIARVRAMQRQPQEQESDIELGEGEDQLFEDVQPWFDMNQIMPYVQAAVMVALVVVALVLISRMSRKRKKPAQVEEEIINLGFWNNLVADLKSLFGGGVAAVKAALAPAESLDPRSPRMLFRRLQTWGEGVGRPRWHNETPNTYGNVLGGARPAQAGAVDRVTEVYNQARYGRTAPGEADVAAAAEAVARLEAEKPNE